MSRPRPLRAWWGYHRDAFDAEGVKRRRDDIKVLWAIGPARDAGLLRQRIRAWWAGDRPQHHAPVHSDYPPLLALHAKHLRASALSAYIYGVGSVLAYAGVVWQLLMFSATWLITTIWALAMVAFALQALSAAAHNWRLCGGQGGIVEFLDASGPRWPRLRM